MAELDEAESNPRRFVKLPGGRLVKCWLVECDCV